MFTITDVLDLAIQLEADAERIYRGLLARRLTDDVRSVLEWMAVEEARHARWLGRLKMRLAGPLEDPALQDMGRDMLRAVMDRRCFSLDDVAVDDLASPAALLAAIIRFEEETIGFFSLFEALIDGGDDLAVLRRIIAEERRHLAAVERARTGALTKAGAPPGLPRAAHPRGG